MLFIAPKGQLTSKKKMLCTYIFLVVDSIPLVWYIIDVVNNSIKKGQELMKVIAFINNKGGVGKTASVTTIGHMMATVHGKKVLLVDLDPQGNTSGRYSQTNFIDIFTAIMERRPIETELSIEDVLLNPDMDIHKSIKHTDYEGLDIIPSHLTLAEVEERLKADITTPQQFKLKKALKQVADEYDYCLIDCSPSISILNINGLTAADEVYIPLRCDGDSCIGLAITRNLVETVSEYNPLLHIGGTFLTQYNNRKNVSREVYGLLEQILPKYEIPLLPICIGTTKYLEENTFEQRPLLEVDSGKNKCSVTLAYMKLTEYIISPNKKKFIEKYQRELKEIERMRQEEEKEI